MIDRQTETKLKVTTFPNIFKVKVEISEKDYLNFEILASLVLPVFIFVCNANFLYILNMFDMYIGL